MLAICGVPAWCPALLHETRPGELDHGGGQPRSTTHACMAGGQAGEGPRSGCNHRRPCDKRDHGATWRGGGMGLCVVWVCRRGEQKSGRGSFEIKPKSRIPVRVVRDGLHPGSERLEGDQPPQRPEARRPCGDTKCMVGIIASIAWLKSGERGGGGGGGRERERGNE